MPEIGPMFVGTVCLLYFDGPGRRHQRTLDEKPRLLPRAQWHGQDERGTAQASVVDLTDGKVQVSMLTNVFLLFNEVFKEFYTGNLHAASAQHFYFGLHGHNALVRGFGERSFSI